MRLALRSRSKRAGRALRWYWLHLLDQLFLIAPLERAAVRRLAVPPAPSVPISRIYADVSVIERSDAGTGIQRVVRSIRNHLPTALGGSVEFHHAIIATNDAGYVTRSGEPLRGFPGALFFGLDFSTDSVFHHRRSLRAFKAAGGQLWFVVHDVLPLSHPHWFTRASVVRYRRWMRTCAALADGIICVSPVVARQIADLLQSHYGRHDLPQIGTIELGSNISPADRHPAVSDLPLRPGLSRTTFERAALVVGTLEPRKGHSDVLAAFEELWKQGETIPLILIGRPGWGTADLQRRILSHPQQGRLLFWLDDVDDHRLHAAYAHCRIVIVPSLAEGYGLPLDEALALGAPVLARDIPVFARHVDSSVAYFEKQADSAAIAAAIRQTYLEASRPRRLHPLRNWLDTATQVADLLLSGTK